MTKINSFEDIQCWQKAGKFVVEIYSVFATSKDFAFKDQIQRAAVSIMNNIAEGFERQSNKEFRQFLFIAKGSAGEVRSMLYIASKLGYIDSNKRDSLMKDVSEISKMLSGLIKTL